MKPRPRARPISHRRARLLVSKTWDGEVTEAEVRELAAHLAECAACRAEARRMQGFFARLDACLKRRRRLGTK